MTDVYAAREDPVAGVGGKLVVDAATELRPGLTVGVDAGAGTGGVAFSRDARGPATCVLTVGAGDVDRAAPLVLELLTTRARR